MLQDMEKIVLPGCLTGEQKEKIIDLLSAIDPSLHSHQEKKLLHHLEGVWRNCATLTEKLNIPHNPLLLLVGALTHDIGKADQRFQNYLFGKGKGVKHAFPSAWITLLLSREIGISYQQAIWAAEIVRRHHTGLVGITDMTNEWLPDDLSLDELQGNIQNLLPAYQPRWAQSDLKKLDHIFFDLEEDIDEELWLQVRLMYSLLIASDRMDALGIQETQNNSFPAFHMPSFPPTNSEVSAWRNQVQEACLQNALSMISGPGAYSLTLPTGSGKTLAGLIIANALIKKFDYKSLIYTLPFISIVEQTSQNTVEIYTEDCIQEDHSQISFSGKDSENPWQRMTEMFRYWYKPVILTTLAQLWDAIFSPTANRSMNFHRLNRAVVILDEPQTIPTAYWSGFAAALNLLSKKLGTIFILMTATQPQIIERDQKNLELSPQPYHFPKIRHTYKTIQINETIEIDYLPRIVEENRLLDRQSGLLVCNTRRSALQTYDLVVQESRIDPSRLFFMSTWLTPWRRKRVLTALKHAEKQGEKRFLVSTQVIEAGVDLDFEWALRDFGPLDSIIQVAGRCNRHANREEPGQVFIIRFCESDNKLKRSFASMVYDRVMLDATLEVLRDSPVFDEQKVPDLVERYYRAVKSRITPNPIMKEIKKGNWGQFFPLYQEQRVSTCLIVIEETPEVSDLVGHLENNIWSLANLPEKKRTLQQLQQFLIEIPQTLLPEVQMKCSRMIHNGEIFTPVLGGSMWFLGKEAIGTEKKHLYHPTKGFQPPEEQEEVYIF